MDNKENVDLNNNNVEMEDNTNNAQVISKGCIEGVFSVVFAVMSYILWWPLAIIGIGLGFAGIKNSDKYNSIDSAIIGIILNVIFLFFKLF